MLSKILIVLGVAGGVGSIVIMTLTSPSEAGPLGIILLFASIYTVVLSTTTFGLLYLNRIAKRLPLGGIAKRLQPMSVRRAYYYSSLISLGPVLLIGMQSVSGVGLYEAGLVLVLMILGCVYVARKLP